MTVFIRNVFTHNEIKRKRCWSFTNVIITNITNRETKTPPIGYVQINTCFGFRVNVGPKSKSVDCIPFTFVHVNSVTTVPIFLNLFLYKFNSHSSLFILLTMVSFQVFGYPENEDKLRIYIFSVFPTTRRIMKVGTKISHHFRISS